MDKVKAQATVLADKAQTGVQQGQTKLQEMQTGKQEDHLLRELGAYVFLSERGRIQPDSEAKVAGIMSQLDALEAAGSPVVPAAPYRRVACHRPSRPPIPCLQPMADRLPQGGPSPSRAVVSRASSGDDLPEA
jgi:hypothetical protein